ncbi:MAG: flavin reductase family protein [Nitrospinaceae bacterium]
MTSQSDYFSIHPEDYFWVEIYHLMNSIVQPRPIAWIATVSEKGTHNLSPFSYFNICSMNPPVISNSIFFNRDGSEKDTLKNIKGVGKYVVGTVSSETAEKANLSSAPFDSNADEFIEAGVSYVDRGTKEPRLIAESPIQLICELHQTVPLGKGAGVGTLVLGNVREILVTTRWGQREWKKGIPPGLMKNVGRMGEDYYARTTDLFRMPRATVKK